MSANPKGGRPTKGKVDHAGPADLQSLAIDPTWTRELAGIYRGILSSPLKNAGFRIHP